MLLQLCPCQWDSVTFGDHMWPHSTLQLDPLGFALDLPWLSQRFGFILAPWEPYRSCRMAADPIIIPHIQIASKMQYRRCPPFSHKPWQTHISIISLNTSCPLQTLTEFQPFVHVSPAFFEAPDVKLLPAFGHETNVSSSTSLSRRNQLAKARNFPKSLKEMGIWDTSSDFDDFELVNIFLKKEASHFAVPIYTRMSHLLTWNMGICHIQS